ncbi:dephospho-CoA kinase [Entomospira culicis]|uniref:Dephospho-CoA kinase n=1 Tax=Entomospira culicis TaxID=2719989 RepID=A0A968GDM4_9SPIO|nr:dephospho-CoA kinase [Entomospira culicis]NIZ18465.1 dephospho-CoA kinase [Entomospira culicis]NIZ68681.1 dephospho-CoA kinase [Entomospira culicis]WDI37280.1 dephospho-CoA kinase [Entomospira culicis]WDI38909.1 dephospho-CoA kinase [Entomospira culicis]
MVLGVCGKACGGKDAVSRLLADDGWLVIDADKLGQEALQVKEREIVVAFMEDDIFDDAGGLDRKKLGRVVFSDKKKLDTLNQISHPYVVEKIHQVLAEHAGERIVINAALLPMVKVEGVDALIYVQAKLCQRMKRALVRDKRSLGFVIRRIWAQRLLRPQLFWKNVDIYYINNNESLADLARELNIILDKIAGK